MSEMQEPILEPTKKTYYEQNKDRLRTKAHDYYWNHRQEILEKAKRPENRAKKCAYYAEHREQVRQRKRRSYRENPTYRKLALDWQRKHPERTMRVKNPKRYNAYQKKDYWKNREVRLKKNKLYQRALRAEVLAAYGGTCKCCSETVAEFLCIDHVNGGGARHRREIVGKGSRDVYSWLKKSGYPKAGFQVLCHNCNLAKQFYGVCPHRAA